MLAIAIRAVVVRASCTRQVLLAFVCSCAFEPMAPPQPLQLSRTFLISPIVWSRPRQQQLQHSAMPAQSKEAAAYHFAYPEEGLRFRDHFSSLLFSGDWGLTLLELGSLAGLTTAAVLLPAEKVNVEGSMPLRELAALLWTKVAVTRLYNTYCEAVFFAFPQYRIQPPREHALKAWVRLEG